MGNKQELRNASTLGLDKRVRDCAYLIGDKRLLCKLSSSDMFAIDAIYHCAYLTGFYRKAESAGCDLTESYKTQVLRAHVLNELLDHIEYLLVLYGTSCRGEHMSLQIIEYKTSRTDIHFLPLFDRPKINIVFSNTLKARSCIAKQVHNSKTTL